MSRMEWLVKKLEGERSCSICGAVRIGHTVVGERRQPLCSRCFMAYSVLKNPETKFRLAKLLAGA
jgi:hypothetical protein